MVSFIILHYKNIEDTLCCIKSIMNLSSKKKISIIVVDNNSLTLEEEKSVLKYTKDLVKLNKNYGFAVGNNKGTRYAIEKYHPDFLCVINNDIIIYQKQFIEEIYDCYEKTNFDILGPKILTNNGDSVNPFYAYQTLEEIEKKINYSKKLIKIYENIILRNILKIYMKVKHIFIKQKKLENGKYSMFNVALHGCSLIFSKKYYKKYQDVFYKETFLYHEEEFLDYRRRHDNLITYYDSNLEVIHKEGSSLNKAFNEPYEKLIFRHTEIIKSLSLLKKVIKENKKI